VVDPAVTDNSGLDPVELEAARRLFIAEAEEGLAVVESGLLGLEQRPDDAEVIASVFRAVHTLKGNSGAFGLTAVGALAHALEDVLGDFRKGASAPTSQRISLLLAGVDALRDLLAEGSAAPRELSGPIEDLRIRLAALRGTPAAGARPAGQVKGGVEGAGAPALPSSALAGSLRVSISCSASRVRSPSLARACRR
jgi:two-component system chemotaxis sensor kinase CheA